MKVVCEKCKKEYFLDDAKIKDDLVKVKCTNCDHHFKIRRLNAKVNTRVATGSKKEESGGATWRVKLANGSTYGFNDTSIIKTWINEGKLNEDGKISYNGSAWKIITEFDEFRELFLDKSKEDNEDTITASGDFLEEELIDEEEEILAGDVTKREVLSTKTLEISELSEIEEAEEVDEIEEEEDESDSYGGDTTISFQDERKTPKKARKEIEESLIIDEDSFLRKKIESIKDKKRGKRKLILIIFVILFIGSLGAGSYYFKNEIIKKIKPIYSKVTKKIFKDKKKEKREEAQTENNPPLKKESKLPEVVELVNFHTIGSHNKARELLAKYEGEHPEIDISAIKAENLALLGLLLKDKQLIEEAREVATMSLSRLGSDVGSDAEKAITTLAIYYIFNPSKNKEKDLVNKYIYQAIKINPTEPLAYNILGLYHKEQAEVLESKEQFKKAIKLDENNVIAHRELLEFAKSEDDVAGVAYHSSIIQKVEDSVAEKYPNIFKKSKKIKKTSVDIPIDEEKIIKKESKKSKRENIPHEEKSGSGSGMRVEVGEESNKKAKTHFAKGSYYYIKGKYEEAKKEYESAIALNPNNANYHFRLALTLQDLFLTDQAIKEYERAVSLDPKMSQSYRKMGDIYSQFGDQNKSKEAYKKYLKLEPMAQDREEVRGLINEMSQ